MLIRLALRSICKRIDVLGIPRQTGTQYVRVNFFENKKVAVNEYF